MLICPICHAQLVRNGNVFECTQHHTFDSAKEGYVNLVTRKLSPTIGDTKQMVSARRSVLDGGLYAPLSDTLNTLVVNYLSAMRTGDDSGEGSERVLLDAGCGEGYYLGRLLSSLQVQQTTMRVQCFGVDISKEAIRMAARRYTGIQFIVADINTHLIFADGIFHMLLNIFAPRNVGEFARILTSGGVVLVVIPGERHLHQLREVLPLLNIQANKPQLVEEQFAPYFKHVATLPVSYLRHLSQQEIERVVMMTPNYWHLSDEIRAQLKAIEELETEIAFVCLVFQKR